MKDIENSGERMVPEYAKGGLIYAEHVTRYNAALDIAEGKIVLDIASGSGYGAKMLATKATHVYGVELDLDAVEYARAHYSAGNIEFLQGDATKIPLPDNSVDVVVTFETIEHVEKYQEFVKEIDRVLKKDGVLLVSTPNDQEFAEGNHFHIHQFQYDELVNLLKPNFPYIDSYFEGTWKYAAIGDATFVSRETTVQLETTNYAPLEPSKYLYFFLVCSREEIKFKLKPVATIGEHYSDSDIARAWKASNAHTERLQSEAGERIHELESQNTALAAEQVRLSAELAGIINSRSYRLARKLANAKRKIGGK